MDLGSVFVYVFVNIGGVLLAYSDREIEEKNSGLT